MTNDVADESVRVGDVDGDGKLSLQEFFQTLEDPENGEEDEEFWETWLGMRTGALGWGLHSAEPGPACEGW